MKPANIEIQTTTDSERLGMWNWEETPENGIKDLQELIAITQNMYKYILYKTNSECGVQTML